MKFLRSIFTNWKTTAAGLAVICGALGDVFHQLSTGGIDPNHLWADAMAIMSGVGLIVAQDGSSGIALSPK